MPSFVGCIAGVSEIPIRCFSAWVRALELELGMYYFKYSSVYSNSWVENEEMDIIINYVIYHEFL